MIIAYLYLFIDIQYSIWSYNIKRYKIIAYSYIFFIFYSIFLLQFFGNVLECIFI